MKLDLIYNHGSEDILIRFVLYENEEAFCVGFGKTAEEARADVKGWIGKESEVLKRSFRAEKDKPFIALLKKKKDGVVIKTSEPINLLEVFRDVVPGNSAQITATHVDF
jgi:hypothetical protein